MYIIFVLQVVYSISFVWTCSGITTTHTHGADSLALAQCFIVSRIKKTCQEIILDNNLVRSKRQRNFKKRERNKKKKYKFFQGITTVASLSRFDWIAGGFVGIQTPVTLSDSDVHCLYRIYRFRHKTSKRSVNITDYSMYNV